MCSISVHYRTLYPYTTNQQTQIYNNVLSGVIIKCNIQWFYYSLFYNYLYIDYIIVIRQTDDGHWSDRNMLVENNNV